MVVAAKHHYDSCVRIVEVEEGDAGRLVRLMDALDDHDDVQNVSGNFDISEKEIEASLA